MGIFWWGIIIIIAPIEGYKKGMQIIHFYAN